MKQFGPFPGDADEGLPEFGTAAHKHDGIVDAVQHEQVPHVRPREQNGVAVAFQPEAPVQSDGVTRNGECAQRKRQDVGRHDQGRLNFQSVDLRAFRLESLGAGRLVTVLLDG